MAEFGKFVFNGGDPVDIRDRKAVATDAQTLTAAQKAQARTNIDVPSTADMTSVVNAAKVVEVDMGTISSIPSTAVSNSKITTNHVVVNQVFGNPAAQTGDWTVTTSAGSVQVTAGTISGSTSLKLYLAPKA